MTGRGVGRRARAIAMAAMIVLLTGSGLALQAMGGPPDVAETLLPLAFAVLGLVVATRAPSNALGWLLLVIGLLMSGGQAGDSLMFVARDHFDNLLLAQIATVSTGWMWFPTLALLATFCLLLFPDGRLPGPRWRPVAWLAAGGIGLGVTAMVTFSFFELDTLVRDPYSDVDGPPAVGVALAVAGAALAVAVIAAVASLFVRWRKATGTQRLQLKWFAFGGVVQLLGLVASFIEHPVATFVAESSTLALPAAATLAIVRYRLYDIDRIISRTVTYVVLTALLLVVYLGAVTALTSITAPVAGDSPLAVAVATLLAAAAFGPARHRIQGAVDRRFNRLRYDAAAVAASYRTRLRDEVDLASLRADFLQTVSATVHPAAALLWLPESWEQET